VPSQGRFQPLSQPSQAVSGHPSREELHFAWSRYYSGMTRDTAIETARFHIQALVRRMRVIGRKRVVDYLGYDVRNLERTLCMALSVHQQVLRGLTSVSRGV